MTDPVSLALQQLSQQWRDKASTSCEEADRIRRTIHAATDAEERCLVRAEVWRGCAEALDTLRGQLEQATVQTECCDVPVTSDRRFCPKCGWEFRVAAPSATGDAPTPDRPLQVCHDALVEARHRIAELEAALSVDKGSADERLAAIRAVVVDIRRRKPEDGRWKSGANWSLVADDLEYLLNRVAASDGWRDIASKEK